MKSHCVKRRRAETQKCGLSDKKRSGATPRLVKLQRPPPDIRILAPALSVCSRSKTFRPRCPAVSAHIRPAAPAPRMMASKSSEFAVTRPSHKLARAPATRIIHLSATTFIVIGKAACNRSTCVIVGMAASTRAFPALDLLDGWREGDVAGEGRGRFPWTPLYRPSSVNPGDRRGGVQTASDICARYP